MLGAAPSWGDGLPGGQREWSDLAVWHACPRGPALSSDKPAELWENLPFSEIEVQEGMEVHLWAVPVCARDPVTKSKGPEVFMVSQGTVPQWHPLICTHV